MNGGISRSLLTGEFIIQEKNAIINIENLPALQGYRRQLQQLLQNLLSNALKYSRVDVPVRIDIFATRVSKTDRAYHRVTVKDNGIGFEQEYADRIFQMFTRLHSVREYRGTGVGLSIVKKVVENHNGFIEVDSVPGRGSTFSVHFPAELH
ncbi:MAG: ATP-binding protein [Sphingobacteriales bacterium]|nr:MAG: ATP-binding protein [Sphingobacteriales bacterium]